MKNVLFYAFAVVLIPAATLFLLEGVYSVTRGNQVHRSVTFQTVDLVGKTLGKEPDVIGVYAPMFADGSRIDELLPMIREQVVGLGNVPFPDAKIEAAAVNVEVDGCPELKPNLRKTGFYLRSNAFNPFDPPSIFYDQDKDLDPKLAEFFEHYGARHVSITTNEHGERRTLPEVNRPKKVLIAGDSVAFGAMIDDSETLSSQLQALDSERQYINLGVSGSNAEEVICRLQAATERRYDGQIDELIYVYCENDLKYKLPYGKPKEAIGWVQDFAERQNIRKVTIVFAPYIYLAAPEVTRFRGYVGGSTPHRVDRRQDLIEAVAQTDFNWIDYGEIAREAIESSSSQFGFFPLYTDHAHLSPEGTRRLVERLRAL